MLDQSEKFSMNPTSSIEPSGLDVLSLLSDSRLKAAADAITTAKQLDLINADVRAESQPPERNAEQEAREKRQLNQLLLQGSYLALSRSQIWLRYRKF